MIVRQQQWRLFVDRWCATALDFELFWGPRAAAEFIEGLTPVSDRDDWLDEVFCEGAAVLDEDTRTLVWFGGEDLTHDIPERRAFLQLMQCQWGGWTTRWAPGGVVEVGGYLGLPAARFLVESNVEGEFVVCNDGSPRSFETLLTVRRSGVCLAGRLAGESWRLATSSSQLALFLDAATEQSIVWAREVPVAGIHLDVDNRALYYWTAECTANIAERVRHGWSGWQTHWLVDNFEEHLRMAAIDIRFPQRSLAELQRIRLGYLRDACKRRPVPSQPPTERLRLLDDLESRVPIANY